MSDEALLQFYQDAVTVLRRELGHCAFQSLKLNFGDYRYASPLPSYE